MNAITKIGIGAAVVVAAFIAVPALKGPVNRIRNNTNEALNSEYVVDNYKAEYLSLRDKRKEVCGNIEKFKIEIAVAQKKLAYAEKTESLAKSNLFAVGTSDLSKFNIAKDAYELSKSEVSNTKAIVEAYSNGLVKLEKTLAIVESNMLKAKTNVATLESKKTLVDSMKSVNKTIENIQGVSREGLAVDTEKLDEDVIRESIKLEAMQDMNSSASPMDKNSAEAYLKNIK